MRSPDDCSADDSRSEGLVVAIGTPRLLLQRVPEGMRADGSGQAADANACDPSGHPARRSNQLHWQVSWLASHHGYLAFPTAWLSVTIGR